MPSANAATAAALKATPVFVAPKPSLSNRFATNGASSYFIDRAGRLWAWGSNEVGELGNGSIIDSPTPVRVKFPAKLGHAAIIRLTVTEDGSVYALDSVGHLWAWGYNRHGQLGVGFGDIENHLTATRVDFPAALGTALIVSIAANHEGFDSVYAVDSLGRLWAWGNNENGQLGDGSLTGHETPVRVKFPAALGHASITSVAVYNDEGGFIAIYALDNAGRLWAWGDDDVGELGNGSVNVDFTMHPAQVRFPRNAGAVSIDSFVTGSSGDFFALDHAGRLWACGNNENGRLGVGSTTSQSTPVQVRFPTHWWQRSVSIVSVVAARYSYGASYAIDSAGRLWSWGGNRYGALGQDTSAAQLTPQRVQFPPALRGDSIVSLGADGYAAYAIDSAGRLWAWGNNRYGQLGSGHIANRFNPPALVRFPGDLGSASIVSVSARSPNFVSAFAYATDSMGHLWGWGYNNHGQLGDASNAIVALPTRIRFQAGVAQ